VPVGTLLRQALQKPDYQIVGAPGWIDDLVFARADRRLGPDLKATPADCQATIAERLDAAKAAAGRGGPPALPSFPGPNDPLPCGFVRLTPGFVAGTARTLAQIVPTLSDLARRPVIDKTGLTGRYDFALRFAAETAGLAGQSRLPGAPPQTIDPDAPSFFTAVEEKLGLKLESARGLVEVVAIDKLEKPTVD